MASYISSSANRFYTALESAYGNVAAIQAVNRIPALKLSVRQQLEVAQRKDKTGSRTFTGLPAGGRRRTEFEIRTYLTSWQREVGPPAYGPLFQAALGGTPLPFAGGTVASASSGGAVTFTAPHGLSVGQAITANGEMRFSAAVTDARSIQLNAPLSVTPGPGSVIGATMTYALAAELPSVSVFDYWTPATAVQRLLCGAAVDQLEILINGDYHEFRFSGIAQDVCDSASLSGGAGALESFPPEPSPDAFDYSIVAGNMGQAWLGVSPSQFFTITNASIVLRNALNTRGNEFGSRLPRAVSPGQRSVTAAIDLYGLDDEATKGLYQAARQESPIRIMFQLGEVEGQLMAIQMKSVIPEVPEFDDSDNRLQWHFRASRAQGTVDDELALAFG